MRDVTRTFTVSAPDGALLQVQEYAAISPTEAPTVVLAHGWTLTRDSWLPVVEQLVSSGLRVVAYDQRGHGGSGRLSGRASVRSLGDDLSAVLEVVAPSGPVVLGGHSMGGMTVMAYAGLHPEEFASRVVGVVLVSTSAGELRSTGLPTLEARAMWLASRLPQVRAGRLVTTRGQRRLLFGVDADPEHVRLTREQVAGTSLPTMGRFFRALGAHDEASALEHFAGVPTVVLVGDCDKLTPVRHGERLAQLVPHAELRVLEGRGHMLAYEATDEVVAAVWSVVEAAQAEAN
jgi:pimeloyl-ACP methyl ester carboxylesterase